MAISRPKKTKLISLGLLQSDVKNAQAKTIAAFIRLSHNPQMRPQPLDMGQIAGKMPAFFALDAAFKTGMNEQIFREKVLTLFEFIPSAVSDAEFDAAWNAMAEPISEQTTQALQKIKAAHNTDIVLVSATNPIHAKHILGKECPRQENPLDCGGFNLFVSYLDPSFGANPETALYATAIKTMGLAESDVEIVLAAESHSPLQPVKQRDDARIANARAFAQARGIPVISVDITHQSLLVVLEAHLEKSVSSSSTARLFDSLNLSPEAAAAAAPAVNDDDLPLPLPPTLGRQNSSVDKEQPDAAAPCRPSFS